ncbi:MAG: MerR family transcriptional regulator [Micromonosporaceae bacterium]|nr:MerR family transcriptional regulator [Micromonosporaceae bacterium]
MEYSVGQLARLAGVSVRTLHHYDEVKLLVPGGRTGGGYRRYNEQDLERLQRILFYRELGFPLEEIATILDDPDADAMTHLHRQHGLLSARLHRLVAMITAVEREMEARQMGISLTPEERFEVFGEHDPGQYADEVRERWGETDAYRTSQQRTARYGKQDWLQIRAEAAELDRGFAAALGAGAPAGGGQAMDLAEQHRQHISRWFYDCPYEIHRGLGDMYLADPRFTQRYEQIAPGLAQYVRDAIHANADRPH